MLLPVLVVVLRLITTGAAAVACTSHANCSYNGECVQPGGTCHCYPQVHKAQSTSRKLPPTKLKLTHALSNVRTLAELCAVEGKAVRVA